MPNKTNIGNSSLMNNWLNQNLKNNNQVGVILPSKNVPKLNELHLPLC